MPTNEYLVISRGQWDPSVPSEKIQTAIDDFYLWLEGLIAEGKAKPGQRLSTAGRTVARPHQITDGPFGETKEVVGGYWFFLAETLEEAAAIAAQNPCMQVGLFYEIRPIETCRAEATALTNETPRR